MQLLDDLDVPPATHPEGRGRPFPHTIHGENGSLFERRREEGARGVGLVMLGVEDLAAIPQRRTELPIHIQLVLEPDRGGQEKRPEAARSDAEIGAENPLELE